MQKTKRSRTRRGICRVFGVLWLALLTFAVTGLAQQPADWVVGDVFVGTGGGNYQVWHSANPLASKAVYTLTTVNDGLNGATRGCTFDSAYRLFGTDSTNTTNDVVRFAINNADDIKNAPPPVAISSFSGFTGTQSLAFDSNGNFYVGYANGGLEKYSHNGTFLPPAFQPSPSSNWIDVAADGHTIFYTSLSRKIYKFDTTNPSHGSWVYADLSLVSSASKGTLHAIRIFPLANGAPGDGTNGVLVADEDAIRLVTGTCPVTSTSDCTSAPSLISNTKLKGNFQTLSLDPLSTSPGNPSTATFWAGDVSTNNVFKATLSSTKPIATITTGVPTSTPLGGICVDGSFSPAQLAFATQLPPTTSNSGCTAAPENGLTCNLTPCKCTGNSCPSSCDNNTATFTSPYSGQILTITLADLSNNASLTLRDSLVDPSVAQSDPTVFSFIPNSNGIPNFNGLVAGNIPCLNVGSGCEVFEFEANPNSGYSDGNLQICPPNSPTCTFPSSATSNLPNLRLLKNLDEDTTTGLDGLGGRTKCVTTVNMQTDSPSICNPATDTAVVGFESPVGSTIFSKKLNSSISFKFQIGQFSNGACNANTSPPLCPSTGPCVTPLLLISQSDTGGAPAPLESCSSTLSTQCITVAGGSSQSFLPPIFVLSGNTWQLQIKTSTMNAGSYLATVVDLNSEIPTFSVPFTLQ